MNATNEGHQHRVTRPDAPADVETEMAEEEGSEMAGPVRLTQRSAALFRLTYASAPVVLLKV
jgi:hypothetical protein